ncbi:MAG: 30S ribosomal protein S17 [Actinobacteria bacterium]|nr:30S ribosomal protein S17 [Actinomycetota bacterium]
MVAVPEQEPPAAGAQPETEAAKAAEVEPQATPEPVQPDDGEPVEAPAAVGETESAVEPEAVAEEPVAEEPVAEEPVAEAEVVADEPTGEEPAPKAPAAEAPAAPVQQSGPKPKRKRLPRSLRPQRTRRKRDKASERKPIVRLPKPEQELGRRQERQGTVVSDAMDKTIVVKVDTIGMHRRYKKVIRQSKKFHAHDETNQAKLGDVVRIVETRPLSKSKNWRLAEIVEVAK